MKIISHNIIHSFEAFTPPETLAESLTSRERERERSRQADPRLYVKRVGRLVGREPIQLMIHLPTRRNERLLGRVCVTYSAYDGANRDQAAGKPVLLAEPERHLLRVAVI